MGVLNQTQTTPQGFVDNHCHALVEGEEVYFAFRTIRDWIAFTDWRIIYVDVQGLLGTKKEYLTIPYRSITAFSITSAGTIDIDAEIAVFLSGHPPIEFKVGKFTNTEALQKLLAKRMNLIE